MSLSCRYGIDMVWYHDMDQWIGFHAENLNWKPCVFFMKIVGLNLEPGKFPINQSNDNEKISTGTHYVTRKSIVKSMGKSCQYVGFVGNIFCVYRDGIWYMV